MGHSEVSMREGDAIELLKVGCAGWWFVRVLGNSIVFKLHMYINVFILYNTGIICNT